jgi:hypothetical protein
VAHDPDPGLLDDSGIPLRSFPVFHRPQRELMAVLEAQSHNVAAVEIYRFTKEANTALESVVAPLPFADLGCRLSQRVH